MTEINNKELKEFWEWCGLQTNYKDEIQYWYGPDGTLVGQGFWEWCPTIDLNNLFKYAMPKVTNELLKPVELLAYPHTRSDIGFHCHLNGELRQGASESGDPAQALYQAIQKTRKVSNDRDK